MARYAAAIYQGTTGTRFMVFDSEGQVVTSMYEEHKQIYPQPGWVEHDATEIWAKTYRVIDGALGAELLAAFKAYLEDPVTMLV